jgi:hypothetical protein
MVVVCGEQVIGAEQTRSRAPAPVAEWVKIGFAA